MRKKWPWKWLSLIHISMCIRDRGVDGKEEYTVYMAPVGVRDESRNATGTQKLYADV